MDKLIIALINTYITNLNYQKELNDYLINIHEISDKEYTQTNKLYQIKIDILKEIQQKIVSIAEGF